MTDQNHPHSDSRPRLNREWHATHRLGPKASLEERIDWHMLHAENCACRPMPAAIREELEARGWTAPTPAACGDETAAHFASELIEGRAVP